MTQTEDWVRIARRAARAARRRLRRAHHGGAVGDALLRSRVAAGRRSSGRHRGRSSTSGSRRRIRRRSRCTRCATPRRWRARWDERGRDVTDLVARARRPLPRVVRRAARIRASRRSTSSSSSCRPRRPRRARADARGRAAGSIRPTAASTWRSGRAARARRAGWRSRRRTPTGRWRGRESGSRVSRPARTRRCSIDLERGARARRGCGCAPTSRSTGTGSRWPSAADAAADRRGCQPSQRRAARSAASRRRRRRAARRRRRRSTSALANIAQRWRDLVGYYTRFGDVNASCWPASTIDT